MRIFPSSALAIALLVGASAIASEPAGTIEIPLEEIWALRMPGTKDINELNEPGSQEPFVERVLLQIRDSWNRRSGMAVQGEGREALENLYRVRTKYLPQNAVKADSPISLAIFTRGTREVVYLESVRRSDRTFTIRYRLAPTHAKMTRSTIALISVGELKAGVYKVSLERLPLEQNYIERGFSEPSREWINNICRSFSFSVTEAR